MIDQERLKDARKILMDHFIMKYRLGLHETSNFICSDYNKLLDNLQLSDKMNRY